MAHAKISFRRQSRLVVALFAVVAWPLAAMADGDAVGFWQLDQRVERQPAHDAEWACLHLGSDGRFSLTGKFPHGHSKAPVDVAGTYELKGHRLELSAPETDQPFVAVKIIVQEKRLILIPIGDGADVPEAVLLRTSSCERGPAP